ncbi:hypothetical protein, partial [Microcoleus anatoxicus]|uniref:hypothetical protein n=1 Tax=Microcoleus anatoxicus TaxID=2705319 RepID=UPI0030C9FA5C
PPPAPPKGGWGKGDERSDSYPPATIRGARSDLDLIVKQQSVATFDLKLTPMAGGPVTQF